MMEPNGTNDPEMDSETRKTGTMLPLLASIYEFTVQ